jgi:hypothetical protein
MFCDRCNSEQTNKKFENTEAVSHDSLVREAVFSGSFHSPNQILLNSGRICLQSRARSLALSTERALSDGDWSDDRFT